MATRRDFIKAGAAAAGAVGLASAGRAASVASSHTFHRIIYDTRFAESRAFGAEAARLGHSVVRMDGDVTRVWRDDLAVLWRRTPRAIAGMTAPDALFCIEQLAYDAGLRAVLRIDHRVTGETAVHRIEGSSDLASFGPAAAGFPLEAARVIDSCVYGTTPLGPTCLAPRRAGQQAPLVTWAFVPPTSLREYA